MIVAGRDDRGLAPQIPALAADAGYPLLADPLSGARSGPAAIAHYDALVRNDPVPEVVIRVGDLPTSKPLREWLARHADARQILVDPQGAWQDPAAVVDTVLRCDPRGAVGAAAGRARLARGLAARRMPAPPPRSTR